MNNKLAKKMLILALVVLLSACDRSDSHNHKQTGDKACTASCDHDHQPVTAKQEKQEHKLTGDKDSDDHDHQPATTKQEKPDSDKACTASCDHDHQPTTAKQEKQEHTLAGDKNSDDHDHDKAPAGHQHSEHNHGNAEAVDLAGIEKRNCEHGIKVLACQDCRSGFGIVKVSGQAKQLLKTETIEPFGLTKNIPLIGEIEINRLKTVTVFPIVTGRVTRIIKKIGDRVVQGDLLAIMHSRDYGKAKLAYISAYQQTTIAKENLTWTTTIHHNLQTLLQTLKKADDHVNLLQILQRLQIGQNKQRLIQVATRYRIASANYQRENKILHSMRQMLQLLKQPESLTDIEKRLYSLRIGEWKSKLLGVALRAKLAHKTYQREKDLGTSGVSTQKEIQQAESDYRSALADFHGTLEAVSFWIDEKKIEIETQLESSLAQYKSVVEEIGIDLKLHRLQAEKEAKEAENRLAIAEKQLTLLGLTPQAIAEIPRRQQNSSFGILQIRAPVAGHIIAFNISEGQYLDLTQPLYTISDLSRLWIWCDLYDHHLAALAHHQDDFRKIQAKVRINSYSNEKFPGKVDYIARVMDKKTRTVKMRVVVENRLGKLRPGMFAEVDISVASDGKVLSIPEQSVFWDESRAFIFKYWKDNYWVRHNITLGNHIGDRYQVASGMTRGDIVVTSGGFFLKSEILKNKMGAG